ncbi:MAG TPA: hypothetical protein VGD83_05075 [Streptosporangiaceae bacterium]
MPYAVAPAEQEPGHAIGRSGCSGTLTARPAGLLFLEEETHRTAPADGARGRREQVPGHR